MPWAWRDGEPSGWLPAIDPTCVSALAEIATRRCGAKVGPRPSADEGL